jgi:hypothetical protein
MVAFFAAVKRVVSVELNLVSSFMSPRPQDSRILGRP